MNEISTQVAAALENVARGISVQDLADAAHSVICPVVCPQAIWALVAFFRHERRQVWVGHLVESRLRGSGTDLARRGAFGLPEDIPQRGGAPAEEGWTYFFHGRGCQFTGPDGTRIDVDFADDGSALEIDPYFFNDYLRSCGEPGWCERQLRSPAGLEDAWHFELISLAAAGLIEREHRFRLTDEGRRVALALEPLVEALDDCEGFTRAYLLARLGDHASAEQATGRARGSIETGHLVARQRQKRWRALQPVLHGRDRWEASHALAALAAFGQAEAFREVQWALAQRPVTALNHTALAVVSLWKGAEVAECLLENLAGLSRASIGTRVKRWLRRSNYVPPADEQPRLGLIVRITRQLLRTWRPDELSAQARTTLRHALAANCRALDDEAGFLLFLLHPDAGRQRLVGNLSSPIPAARSGAACFLAMIGDEWGIDALVQAAGGDPDQGGHEAACALSLIATEKACLSTAQWNRQHDGYEEIEGSEIEIEGRKFSTWSMEEMMRSTFATFCCLTTSAWLRSSDPC